MEDSSSRRKFVKAVASTASLALVDICGLGIPVAYASHSYVRRNVGGMDPSDPVIASYREAIKIMRSLPSADPRSWAYQAAIHGSTVTPALTAWNSCEHGTYFFWSWHRMYLYWFERIVRKLSCDPCWALPYWNWRDPAQHQLPSMFRDTSSELYTPNRNPAINSGAGSLSSSDVNYSTAFGFVDFSDATSSLAGTPHGVVHVRIGGWMGSVPTAGQDPIFYLHHCNIDRLWDLWLAQSGGRVDPVSDTAWTGRRFTFFDENGNQVYMTGCEILRAAEQLQYVYEGEPSQVSQYCESRGGFIPRSVRQWVATIVLAPLELGSEIVSAPINSAALTKIRDAIQTSEDALFLEIDDVVAKSQPGIIWEVYVGLPRNAEPNTDSSYYVGNVVLFGAGIEDEAHHGLKPARFVFPISKAVRAALAQSSEELLISFVPSALLINGRKSKPETKSKVRVGRLSITLQKQAKAT